ERSPSRIERPSQSAAPGGSRPRGCAPKLARASAKQPPFRTLAAIGFLHDVFVGDDAAPPRPNRPRPHTVLSRDQHPPRHAVPVDLRPTIRRASDRQRRTRQGPLQLVPGEEFGQITTNDLEILSHGWPPKDHTEAKGDEEPPSRPLGRRTAERIDWRHDSLSYRGALATS